MKKIVVLPGGFHPFHAGHLALYKSALEAFPGADVYVAASDDQKNRPFPFKLKQLLATEVAGIPKNRFVQVKSPFIPKEITSMDKYDPEKDALIVVRSKKDQNKSPLPDQIRKSDGKMGHYISYPPGKNPALEPFADHAYIAYLPTVPFADGMTSATEIRNAWPKLDELGKIEMIKSMYPEKEMTVPKVKKISQILDSVLGAEQVAETFVDPDQSKQYWNHDSQRDVNTELEMPLRDNDRRGRRQGFNEGEERSDIESAAQDWVERVYRDSPDKSRDDLYQALEKVSHADLGTQHLDYFMGEPLGINLDNKGHIVRMAMIAVDGFDKEDHRNYVSESLNKIRGMIKETTDEQKSKSVDLHRKLFELFEEERDNVVKLSGFRKETDKKVVDIGKARQEKQANQERENNYYSERRAEQEELLARLQAELLNAKQEFAELADAKLLPSDMEDAKKNLDKLIDYISNWEGSKDQNDFKFTEGLLEKLHVKTVQLKEYFGGMRDRSAPRVLRKQEPTLTPKDFWNKIDLSETSDYIEEK